jgi:hypothetical protein
MITARFSAIAGRAFFFTMKLRIDQKGFME